MNNRLHKEGDWYLLSREQAKMYEGYNRNDLARSDYNSFVFHSCKKYTPEAVGIWRYVRKTLHVGCGLCGEVCPDGLQALWIMLNMDIE